MNSRIAKLLKVGSGIVAATGLGLLGLLEFAGPETEAEYRARVMAEDEAVRIPELRKMLREGIATAATPEDRRMAEYDLRLFEFMERGGKWVALVKLHDGIDEFEAYVLSSAIVLADLVAEPRRRP